MRPNIPVDLIEYMFQRWLSRCNEPRCGVFVMRKSGQAASMRIPDIIVAQNQSPCSGEVVLILDHLNPLFHIDKFGDGQRRPVMERQEPLEQADMWGAVLKGQFGRGERGEVLEVVLKVNKVLMD